MIDTDIPYTITTERLAELIGLRPQSIRSRMSRTGSYFGLLPRRLANGRLLWPDDSIRRLAAKQEVRS